MKKKQRKPQAYSLHYNHIDELMMTQSRKHSLAESLIGTAIGFIVSVIITAIVMPAYGHDVSVTQNFQITGIFTVASIARSYLVRRFFNSLRGAA